jgi:hypothetical protein
MEDNVFAGRSFLPLTGYIFNWENYVMIFVFEKVDQGQKKNHAAVLSKLTMIAEKNHAARMGILGQLACD